MRTSRQRLPASQAPHDLASAEDTGHDGGCDGDRGTGEEPDREGGADQRERRPHLPLIIQLVGVHVVHGQRFTAIPTSARATVRICRVSIQSS